MKRQIRFDDSSNLADAAFDSTAEYPLTLRFKSGAVYRYRNVQAHQFAELCGADSAGQYVRRITGNSTAYPFEKLADGAGGADSRAAVALELIASLPASKDLDASAAKLNLDRARFAAQEALK